MKFENNLQELHDYYVGTVMNYDLYERWCEVFIPRLMMALPSSMVNDKKHNLNTSKIINAKELNVATYIEKTNVLRVYAEDLNEPMPEIGSTVLVYFLDGNPKYGYWEKFNPVGKYEVVEAEKYPKHFTLQVGNNIMNVNQDDEIVFKIPDNYEVIVTNENKSKTIEIRLIEELEKEVEEVKEEVVNLNDNMNYIIDEKKILVSDYLNSFRTYVIEQPVSNYYKEFSIAKVIFDDYVMTLKNKLSSIKNNLANISKIETDLKTKYNYFSDLKQKLNKYIGFVNTSSQTTEKKNSLISNAFNLVDFEYPKNINTSVADMYLTYESCRVQLETQKTHSFIYDDTVAKCTRDLYSKVSYDDMTDDLDLLFKAFKIKHTEIEDESNQYIESESDTEQLTATYSNVEDSYFIESYHTDKNISNNNKVNLPDEYVDNKTFYVNICQLDFELAYNVLENGSLYYTIIGSITYDRDNKIEHPFKKSDITYKITLNSTPLYAYSHNEFDEDLWLISNTNNVEIDSDSDQLPEAFQFNKLVDGDILSIEMNYKDAKLIKTYEYKILNNEQ